MLNSIRLRIANMKTLSKLITGAQQQANATGNQKAAVEHYVLSALNLPDGTAGTVFKKLGVKPKQFNAALKKQNDIALKTVGTGNDDSDSEPLATPDELIYEQPSAAEFMRSLHELKKIDKNIPLLGAHTLVVVADMKHGTAIKAFKSLGIENEQLASAANTAINSYAV